MKKATVRFETLDEFRKRTLKDFENLDERKYEGKGISIDPANLPKAFTRKRLEILMVLSSNNVESIRGLSDILDRDYKSVYYDIEKLEDAGFIEVNRKSTSPADISLKYDKIVFDLRKKEKVT